MRSRLCIGNGVLVALLAAACAHAPSHVVVQTLQAGDGLSCQAYLAWENEPVTDVLLSMGGTGTGSLAFIADAVQPVLRERSAAFLTFEKPGITASFGDPAAATIDDGPLSRHTQGTLLGCARAALQQALERWGPSTRVHLRGHSEGALLALFLFDALLSQTPGEAAQIKTLVLTGLPLEPFDALVRRQLADKPKLRRAFDQCDWPAMKSYAGVSCAYLADAQQRPSGREVFEHLAAAHVTVPIRVLQGLDDENAPAREVQKLEQWNTEQGHLDLQVEYYAGAHSGTPEARQKLQQLLLRLVAESPLNGSR